MESNVLSRQCQNLVELQDTELIPGTLIGCVGKPSTSTHWKLGPGTQESPSGNIQLHSSEGTKKDSSALGFFTGCKKTLQLCCSSFLFSSRHQTNLLDCQRIIYMQIPTDGICAATDTSIQFSQFELSLPTLFKTLQYSQGIGIRDNVVPLSGDWSRFGLTTAFKCWLAENMVFSIFQNMWVHGDKNVNFSSCVDFTQRKGVRTLYRHQKQLLKGSGCLDLDKLKIKTKTCLLFKWW